MIQKKIGLKKVEYGPAEYDCLVSDVNLIILEEGEYRHTSGQTTVDSADINEDFVNSVVDTRIFTLEELLDPNSVIFAHEVKIPDYDGKSYYVYTPLSVSTYALNVAFQHIRDDGVILYSKTTQVGKYQTYAVRSLMFAIDSENITNFSFNLESFAGQFRLNHVLHLSSETISITSLFKRLPDDSSLRGVYLIAGEPEPPKPTGVYPNLKIAILNDSYEFE